MQVIDIGHDRKIIYGSAVMQKVVDEIGLFAPTNMPILITGKNGTGKENAARLIHARSTRHEHPFIAINCAAISPNLIESELFGHEKGSFTGADRQHRGAFEQARDGTLFLDEIGEMPPEMQVKLLRVLQDGEFRRVGGNEVLRARPRIISATNRNIESALESGRLREDLYYRLRGTELNMPALSEHREDINQLATYCALRTATTYGLRAPGFSTEALMALEQHDWPGNVRELEGRVGEAVIRAQQEREITPEHLRLGIGKAATVRFTSTNTPVTDLFGYQLNMHREVRGWTQYTLAEKVKELSSKNYTVEDIQQWEANRSIPDAETVNTLAYLLIVNSKRPDTEKTQLLTEFFDAAHAAREVHAHRESPANPTFGTLLGNLRDKAGLTQSALAERIARTQADVHLAQTDIYLIESGNGERKITPNESLALVKALDTAEYALNPKEKLELYEGAKQVFVRQHHIVQETTQKVTREVVSPAEQVAAEPNKTVVTLMPYRSRLKAFFTDANGAMLKTGEIMSRTRLANPTIVSLFNEASVMNPRNTGGLSSTTKARLTALLTDLGKPSEVVTAFGQELDAMRSFVYSDHSAEQVPTTTHASNGSTSNGSVGNLPLPTTLNPPGEGVPTSDLADTDIFKKLLPYRNRIRAFFVDQDGVSLTNEAIKDRAHVTPMALSSLLGKNSSLNPRSVGGVSENNKTKLRQLLADLGKTPDEIAQFDQAFEEVRELVGYVGQAANGLRVRQRPSSSPAIAEDHAPAPVQQSGAEEEIFARIQQLHRQLKAFFVDESGALMLSRLGHATGVSRDVLTSLLSDASSLQDVAAALQNGTKEKLALYLEKTGKSRNVIEEFERAYDAMCTLTAQDVVLLNGETSLGAVRESAPISHAMRVYKQSSANPQPEKLRQLRMDLRAFFTDQEGRPISNSQIATAVGIALHAVISILTENSVMDPRKFGGLSLRTKEALKGYLKDSGKTDEDVARYETAFDALGAYYADTTRTQRIQKQRTAIGSFFVDGGRELDIEQLVHYAPMSREAATALFSSTGEASLGSGEELQETTRDSLSEYLRRHMGKTTAVITAFEKEFDKLRALMQYDETPSLRHAPVMSR